MPAVRTARPRAIQWDVSVDGDPARCITVESSSRDDARFIASRILGVDATGLLAVPASTSRPTAQTHVRLLS